MSLVIITSFLTACFLERNVVKLKRAEKRIWQPQNVGNEEKSAAR